MEKLDNKASGYIEAFFAVIFNVIFYFTVNRFYDNIPFLTKEFVALLPLVNNMIIISIITNATRMINTEYWFKRLVNIINNIVFMYVTYRFWIIFPFDFKDFGNESLFENIARMVIFFSILGTLLATIIEFFKAISNTE